MPDRREDDLDWLYGRERRRTEPEPTRVMPRPEPGTDRRPAAPRPADPPPPQHRSARRPSSTAVADAGTRYAAARDRAPGRAAGWARRSGWGGRARWSRRRPRRPRRRRPVRNTLRTLLVLVLVALVWLVGVPAYAWSQVGRVDDTPSGRRPGEQPGETFLLVGSDSREGLSKAQQKKLGTGSVAGQRTDTIMLVYAPVTGKPVLISLPRDSYVTIPGHGQNKINAAYAIGGPELLVPTVEQATGLRVDGYAEVGFGGFVGVIDALDGIRMCIPSAIKDRDSPPEPQEGLPDVRRHHRPRLRADAQGRPARRPRPRRAAARDAVRGGQVARLAGHRAQPVPLLGAVAPRRPRR